tara:strand:+ start:2372 stop:3376 length:1005 start_codon:yes stop_codon:yes gene_type:complete
MKKHYLVIAQLVLWLAIWFIIGLNEDDFNHFMQRNLGAIVVQIILIFAVSYYLVERWLFQKKYGTFLLISILLIIGLAYFSSQFLFVEPQRALIRPNGLKPPSPLLVHIVLISMAYSISTLLMLFMESQKKEAQLEIQKAELIESELKFLKMQINPHFLFNSLNNIYALSISNSDKTPESIHSLSEMLRYVIYDCEQTKVPIEKEIHYIENFIDLFKLRSSKNFNITFANNIENPSIEVAPMLFITYIENAFKHSGIEKGGDSFVDITLNSNKNDVTLIVENSLPKERIIKDKTGGIGLKNAEKRLEISYPNKYDLNIETSKTFKVELKLMTNA